MLVILGLLVGGVLAGQSLIRAAQIRAVTTEYSRYSTAVFSFRDKYFALPGDMANATSFWGANTGSSGSVSATAAPQVGVFNGDGNGFIEPVANPSPGVFAHQETGSFWQELADAGLIEGQYSGANNYLGDSFDTYGNLSWNNDTSSPKSKTGAWWGVKYISPAWLGYTATTLAGGSGHMFVLSSGGGGCQAMPFPGGGAVLTPSEMWNVDTKMDDGVPNTGKVLVQNSNASQGASGCAFVSGSTCLVQSATLWQYNLSAADAKSCAPVMRGGF